MTVFITFRTSDSLPRSVLDRYLVERRIVDRLLEQSPDDEVLQREKARLFGHHIDRSLDAGTGTCPLRTPELAKVVMESLMRRDGTDYVLHAGVIMPNHVHVVATLGPATQLAKVAQAWKSVTAHAAIREFGHRAPFWQSESYDHIVRNRRSLQAVKRYVTENPTKANLRNWPWVYESVDDEED